MNYKTIDDEINFNNLNYSKKSKKLIIILLILSHIFILLLGFIICYFFVKKDNNDNNNTLRYEDGPLYDIIEKPSFNSHSNTLIYIHGLDNSPLKNAEVLIYPIFPLVPNNTKVVLICAPFTEIPKLQKNGTSWFDIKIPFKLDNDSYNFNDVLNNSKRIIELIDKEAEELGGNYSKIFLFGYSQGACMSMYIGFNIKQELGGIVSLSGVLFPEVLTQSTFNNNTKTKFFICHGESDKVFDIKIHKETYKNFKNYSNFEFKYYKNIGHNSYESFKHDIQTFFSNNMEKNNKENKKFNFKQIL